jgi:hypothetical protein
MFRRLFLITLSLMLVGQVLVMPAHAVELGAKKDAQCRAQIGKVICRAAALGDYSSSQTWDEQQSAYQDRKCLETSERELKILLHIYDTSPAEVRIAFCHIEKIYLVPGEVSFGARSGYYYPNPTPLSSNKVFKFTKAAIGFVLEISLKYRFTIVETSSQYNTRIVQTQFGQNVAKNGIINSLPRSEYLLEGHQYLTLRETVVHEIGHMLSFANNYVSFPRAGNNSWAEIGWTLMNEESLDPYFTPKTANLELWKKHIYAEADIPAAFTMLREAGAATFYGISDPNEDAAESFLRLIIPGNKYYLGDKLVYDWDVDLQSNEIAKAKLAFLRGVLESRADPFELLK